jgi:hypothetical protein
MPLFRWARRARVWCLVPLFAAAVGAVHAGEAAPSVDVLKQALEKRLVSLKPSGMTERNVLFEDVKAGTASGGGYPFQVTASVRDYGPGYPANKFYGETCVGRMEKWPFVLRRDPFGDWQVEGRMTITDARQCKPNPSAGVSAIPLASVAGSPAPQASAAATTKTAAAPAQPPGKSGQPANGAYECWNFTSPRMGLNFTLQGGGRYLDTENKSGSYSFDAASGKLAFKGGALDGQTPIYEAGKGKPKVSFRNAQGREIAFCEHAGR